MKAFFKYVALGLLTVILVPAFFYLMLTVWGSWHDDWSGYTASVSVGDGFCNIAVLPIQGEIHTYGSVSDEYGNPAVSTNLSEALAFIKQAEQEPGIYGVLAVVDSGGGSGAAGHLLAKELQKSVMPNAAYVLDVAASAAYLVASAADTIIASPFSDVGSIGITMSHLNYAVQNEEQGIEYISLSSVPFKDYGDPDKPLTEEERALFERDLSVWHQVLVEEIATNRSMSLEQVNLLADGTTLPSKLALEAGLIDAIGDLDTARTWFATELDMAPEDIIFCQY